VTLEEIRGMAPSDLAKAAEDTREELFKKRFAMAVESVENSKDIREMRKRIARLKTVLREKELAAKKTPAAPAAAKA
jgi:large subunit ribosomal protein L29